MRLLSGLDLFEYIAKGKFLKHSRKRARSVYADLGVPDADSMAVKAQLVIEIADLLKGRGLTQIAAAELLGIPQPKLSRILRGQFRGVSERKLLDCLTRLGKDVDIVIKSMPRSRVTGRLSVVHA